jgi:hypothetical protein
VSVSYPAPGGPPAPGAWAAPAPASWGPGAGPYPWWIPPRPRAPVHRRWLATFGVFAMVAAVVIGGIVVDVAIPAPSAGTVNIGGSVTITAASGWVQVEDPTSSVVILQKGDARLAAQAQPDTTDTSASILAQAEDSLRSDAIQVSFSGERRTTTNGHDTSEVSFGALVQGRTGTGTLDGELVAMIVDGYGVLIEAAAPQGDFEYVIGDVQTMVESVRAGS